MSDANVPNDVNVLDPNVHTSDAVNAPAEIDETGTFRLSTISLPIDPSAVRDEVAAFHTSSAEMLLSAEIRAPKVLDAERIFRLAMFIDDPNDDEALSTFVLFEANVAPSEDEELRTLVLVVAIELPREVEALLRLVVRVVS